MRKTRSTKAKDQMELARGFAALGGKSHCEDEKLFAFMQIFHPGRCKSLTQAREMRRGSK